MHLALHTSCAGVGGYQGWSPPTQRKRVQGMGGRIRGGSEQDVKCISKKKIIKTKTQQNKKIHRVSIVFLT